MLALLPRPRPASQTYGMLIYKLLGDKAQSEFARSWGISYGMNAVTEWQDIAIEAVKGTVVLIIMERLFLTGNSSWLEARGAAAHPQRVHHAHAN